MVKTETVKDSYERILQALADAEVNLHYCRIEALTFLRDYSLDGKIQSALFHVLKLRDELKEALEFLK